MTFYDYVSSLAMDKKSSQTERSYCREVLSNKRIPLESDDGLKIYRALRDEYENNPELREYIISHLRLYETESEKKQELKKRMRQAGELRNAVFDITDCFHDEGDLRFEFKRRPELYLLSNIVEALYSIDERLAEIRDALKDQ